MNKSGEVCAHPAARLQDSRSRLPPKWEGHISVAMKCAGGLSLGLRYRLEHSETCLST